MDKFGCPDVIWMSPDCCSFSIAGISHHRRKNPETGSLDPISDYAKFCDKVDQHCLELIKELNPKYWFIENPRGGYVRCLGCKICQGIQLPIVNILMIYHLSNVE